MLKKFLSLALVLIMVIGCVSVTASADSAVITDLEPNDDPLTAQAIEPNASVEGVIAAPNFDVEDFEDYYIDMDVFKFTLKERSKVVLSLKSSSKTLIPIITDGSDDDEGYMPEIDEDIEDIEDLPETMVIDEYLEKGTYFIILMELFAETETKYEFTITSECAVQSLRKEDGVWKYYVAENFTPETTMLKFKGVWFYVENGIWNKSVNTMFKFEDQWFLIKNGKWNKNTPDTLYKFKDQWFLIKKGKWARETTNTLFKFKGSWFYIKNGKWAKETDIVKYSGRKFYVKGGKAQLDFTGKKKIKGQTYYIKNGKVV